MTSKSYALLREIHLRNGRFRMHFHIVYMPGSVRYLTPLVTSLLHWSNCSFRLVANGCDTFEQTMLDRFCQTNTRLEYMALPYPTPISHGQALTYLQALNQEPTFCFMDSDIFATGPFMPVMSEALNQFTGLFSCTPLWCTKQETIMQNDYARIFGRHNQTEGGLCLGSTYFAIYSNQSLSDVIAKDEIDFRAVPWSHVPDRHLSWLKQCGLGKEYYDTGKLLNLCLNERGYKLQFREVPTLHHIGGFSRFSINSASSWPQRLTTSIGLLLRRDWQRLLVKLPYWIRFEHRFPRKKLVASKLARQVSVERYFSELIISAVENSPPPAWKPIGSRQMIARYDRAATSLMALYG